MIETERGGNMTKFLKVFLSSALITMALAGCTETPHEHSFDAQWSYNETAHWRHSTCEHQGVLADQGEHTFDEGVYHPATFEANGYTIYTCKVCQYQKTVTHNDQLQHHYADIWSYDDQMHWYACLDEGYSHLKKDAAAHTEDNEVIIKDRTDTEAGLAQYTCGICNHTYQKALLLPTSIVRIPEVSGTYYVGQPLSTVALTGGEGSVAGSFRWDTPDQKLTQNGVYTVVFVPDDPDYAPSTAQLSLQAVQLTVTVSTDAYGSASLTGTTNVSYGDKVEISFLPQLGYRLDTLTVNGQSVTAATKYVIESVTTNYTIYATFAPSDVALDIQCLEGTPGAYTIEGNTITVSGITADSIYAISGKLQGNIVINVPDAYKFELEMRGLELTCDYTSPIMILGGDQVTLTAKKDYVNIITDLRDAVSESDSTQKAATIYATCDLEIGGKGTLRVVSQNNNGIHTKDDLEVKNLTLVVTCVDNALKGNDSVTIKSGYIDLTATDGDGIVTVNTDISGKGKQRGIITILGGTVKICAAKNCLVPAFDIVVDDGSSDLEISKYT